MGEEGCNNTVRSAAEEYTIGQARRAARQDKVKSGCGERLWRALQSLWLGVYVCWHVPSLQLSPLQNVCFAECNAGPTYEKEL